MMLKETYMKASGNIYDATAAFWNNKHDDVLAVIKSVASDTGYDYSFLLNLIKEAEKKAGNRFDLFVDIESIIWNAYEQDF